MEITVAWRSEYVTNKELWEGCAHKADRVQARPWQRNTRREPLPRAHPLFDQTGKAIYEAVANQTERGQRSFPSWLLSTLSDKEAGSHGRGSRRPIVGNQNAVKSIGGPCSTDLSDRHTWTSSSCDSMRLSHRLSTTWPSPAL